MIASVGWGGNLQTAAGANQLESRRLLKMKARKDRKCLALVEVQNMPGGLGAATDQVISELQ